MTAAENRQDPAVRSFLADIGVADHVVDGGLGWLIQSWENVAEVESKGRPAWEEWLNDLDGRRVLQEVLDGVPSARVVAEAVAAIDERVRAHTTTSDECVWGDDIAEREGWTRDREWWYWVEPAGGFRTWEDILKEDRVLLWSATDVTEVIAASENEA